MKSYPFLDLESVTAPCRDELAGAALRVIGSGRFVGGPEIETLEQSLAQLLRVPYVVALSNGSDALRLTLRAAIKLGRIKKGQGIVVPANTYIASVLSIFDASLVPIFAEPDPVTMNLSGNTLRQAIEANPDIEIGGIMPVHLYGRVAWDNRMKEIVCERGLFVVEDTAQAIGAESVATEGRYESRHAGGLGDAGCFSFYPTKNVGALGDAGAMVTHDPELAAMVRSLSNYGSSRRYHNEEFGFNCRMDPIQAAFIGVKLRHIEEENQSRRANATLYDSLITHPAIVKPLLPPSGYEKECVWHQYVLRTFRRDEFRAYLNSRGVGTDIHYPVPCHRQPFVAKEFGTLYPQGLPSLPVAEKMAGEIVSLPISSATSLGDVREISAIINSFPH